MRKIFLYILLWITPLTLLAQSSTESAEYFRNALTNMMVYHPEDEFGYEVYRIFSSLPPFERYDNHDIGLRVIDNRHITGVQPSQKGLYRQTYGANMILDSNKKQANAQAILTLLNQAQVGKRMIAQWFNLKGDSLHNAVFSTQTIEKRCHYNATVAEAEKARFLVQGVAGLKDVSEDLIAHSFILVSDITYITAENRATAAKTTLNILGAIIDGLTGSNIGQRSAQVAGDIADSFTGFKVMVHSYLYQLEWNDSLSNEFYLHYYTDTPDTQRLAAFFRDTTLGHIHYLGEESSTYEKTQQKGKYNRMELLELITTRALDENIARLQSRYDDFRIKAPIMARECDSRGKTKGYLVQIGLKEGVKDKARFEVLEARFNKGHIDYQRIAILTPVVNKIWDNRFNALMENNEDEVVQGTLFRLVGTPTKEIVPGMLVRQVKG